MKISEVFICDKCGHRLSDAVSCFYCDSTKVSLRKAINFQDQPGSKSSERIACYSFKKGEITGRTPEKVIEKGTILTGVPYKGVDTSSFVVKEVEYRPHKGPMSHLWFFSARV